MLDERISIPEWAKNDESLATTTNGVISANNDSIGLYDARRAVIEQLQARHVVVAHLRKPIARIVGRVPDSKLRLLGLYPEFKQPGAGLAHLVQMELGESGNALEEDAFWCAQAAMRLYEAARERWEAKPEWHGRSIGNYWTTQVAQQQQVPGKTKRSQAVSVCCGKSNFKVKNESNDGGDIF